MSNATNSNSLILGDLVEVVRQRFFIDHKSDAKTLINEEYTIISRFKLVSNIILQLPNFLPNLTVYDSDGEILPVMSNPYTNALIDGWIEDPETDEKQKKHLTDLLEQTRSRQVFLIWIKLPPQKALVENQVKVITLEYSSKKEKQSSDEMTLNIFSPTSHRVFYIIRKPEDYDFATQILETTNEQGKKMKLKWKKAEDFLHRTETFDVLSITSSSLITQPIILHYSFRPKIHIIAVPMLALVFLVGAVLYVLHIQQCEAGLKCYYPLSENAINLLEIKFQIGAGIIGAALILPRLINNPSIRHKFLLPYFAPIALAIFLFI